ncbi:MAG: PIG-L family deacetylase [archaeon]|nr:MAG: PIG-L family deacetylase [archaeon]
MPKAIWLDPHGDDPIIATGGIQIQLLDKGWEIKQIQMTDGRHGSNILEPHVTKKVRSDEGKKVREYLGIRDFYTFDVEDGTLEKLSKPEKERITDELKKQIEEYEADIVFIPGKAEGHPDHRATYEIGHEAIERMWKKPLEVHYLVWLFPFYRSDPGEIQRVLKVNIDEELEKKLTSIRMNKSQEDEGRYSSMAKNINSYFSLIYSAYRDWDKKSSEIIAIPQLNEKYDEFTRDLRSWEDVTEIFHGRESEKIKA